MIDTRRRLQFNQHLHLTDPDQLKQPPHFRRRLRRTFVWIVLVLMAWSLWGYFFPPAPRLGPITALPAHAGPVLVLAPHSDDESLAAGGLLQQFQARGENPRVVLVTGGDAFRLAAEAHYRRVGVHAPEMLAFGRTRLSESRSALVALGLPPDHLTFLGYPDQGLNRLWQDCWSESNPCSSPTTGVSRVPYAEARTPGSPFAGHALVAELEAIMREVRPGVIVYPHPNEAHVDHWGLSVLVTAALEELRRTDPTWQPPAEWLYLVHRGDWPAPKGFRPQDALLPPAKLADGMTQWHTLALTPEQVQHKGEAIQAYHTQYTILRRYMQSFVRKNELFGTMDRVVLTAAPPHPVPAALLLPPWPDQSWQQVISDPRADTVAREMERGADLLGVYAARQGDTLYLAAHMASSPWPPVEIHFYARGFKTGEGWGQMVHAVVPARGAIRIEPAPAGNSAWQRTADIQGSWIRFSIPLEALGARDSIMVAVESHVGPALIDRSAWRAISLDGR